MGGVAGDDERIDLLAVDRALFVDTPPQRASRSPQVLKWIGLIAVIAVAAVVWWPRPEPPKWRVFEAAPVPVAGLTDQLVFDDPDGQLVAAELPPAPEDFEPELGFVFAEPGGTISTGRWASFRTHETNSSAAQIATEGPLVGGVHADVLRPHFIEWGPVERRNWTVVTNQFAVEEAIDFANHVAIVENRPALASRYDLGALQPVGSIAALDCVEALTELLRGNHLLSPVRPTVVTWATASSGPPTPRYEGATTVGSIAAPSDALPLVEFVLGDGSATTVHGQPAVMIVSKDLGHVGAWMEDGRLIIVTADLPADELIALAESVRPAHSDGEWRSIQRAAFQGFDYGFMTEVPEAVTLYRVVDPDTGTTLVLTVTSHFYFGELVALFACAEERSAAGTLTESHCNSTAVELPLLTIVEGNRRQYVLAIVDRAEADNATLFVELSDGHFQALALNDLSSEIPGVAVATLLSPDRGSIELWNGGQMVASL